MNERMLKAFTDLIADPTSNLTAAAIGISILVLFMLIIVLGLIVLVMPARISSKKRKKKRRKGQGKKPGAGGAPRKKVAAAAAISDDSVSVVEIAEEPGADDVTSQPAAPVRKVRIPTLKLPAMQRRTKRRIRHAGLVVAILLFAVGAVLMYVTTSANTYCTSVCHQMGDATQSWKQSDHKTTACIRCHEGRPGFSVARGIASRTRSFYLAVARETAGSTPVPPQRCLECHGDIRNGAIQGKNAVRMSHKEVLAAGSDCGDCHANRGHEVAGLTAGMSQCLRCHNGATASSECQVCHPRGAEASIERSQAFGDSVDLPSRPSCGGCHSLKKCDACHVVRMPHSENFKEPTQHAMLAAFDKKERACFRCHAPVDCTKCHRDFAAHVIGWEEKHKTYPRNTEYCNWCHKTAQFCDVCHGATSNKKPSDTYVD